MTGTVLVAVVMLLLVLGLARRRGDFILWRFASNRATGIEGGRRLGNKTRAALDAATTMLR